MNSILFPSPLVPHSNYTHKYMMNIIMSIEHFQLNLQINFYGKMFHRINKRSDELTFLQICTLNSFDFYEQKKNKVGQWFIFGSNRSPTFWQTYFVQKNSSRTQFKLFTNWLMKIEIASWDTKYRDSELEWKFMIPGFKIEFSTRNRILL